MPPESRPTRPSALPGALAGVAAWSRGAPGVSPYASLYWPGATAWRPTLDMAWFILLPTNGKEALLFGRASFSICTMAVKLQVLAIALLQS